MADLLRTPLYEWHVTHGGRLVEFGGWSMPVQYQSIVDEHHAVRREAGVFDISHMGRLRFRGPDSCQFLDRVLTNDVARLQVGQVRYSLVCKPDGGILDDVLVYRLPDEYWLVVNASNRTKIVDWLTQHQNGFLVDWRDMTLETGMIAIQGPKYETLLTPAEREIYDSLKYYAVARHPEHTDWLISRTGYTGEEGCELILPASELLPYWRKLTEGRLGPVGGRPCGLGARDTLRLEAGMPLYGHELSEQIDPLTAGLAFAVKLNKPEFISRDALTQLSQSSDRRVRMGLVLEGRRIAREGTPVLHEGRNIGVVTSGTFSPTLERSIAMAYVDRAHSEPGTTVELNVRGRFESAKITQLPFYQRPK